MDKKAFIKYLCALLLFGLNGIVASQISMTSYEIVFMRTLIGSIMLIPVLFSSIKAACPDSSDMRVS